jgi:hypothetical protein
VKSTYLNTPVVKAGGKEGFRGLKSRLSRVFYYLAEKEFAEAGGMKPVFY